jgi:hypothetical protein
MPINYWYIKTCFYFEMEKWEEGFEFSLKRNGKKINILNLQRVLGKLGMGTGPFDAWYILKTSPTLTLSSWKGKRIQHKDIWNWNLLLLRASFELGKLEVYMILRTYFVQQSRPDQSPVRTQKSQKDYYRNKNRYINLIVIKLIGLKNSCLNNTDVLNLWEHSPNYYCLVHSHSNWNLELKGCQDFRKIFYV